MTASTLLTIALAPLLLACIAVLIWQILPRRAKTAQRDADIERQVQALQSHADHSVATRPRVRANDCKTPPATFAKAAPGTPPVRPCSGGLCRKNADCSDRECPGRLDAALRAKSR